MDPFEQGLRLPGQIVLLAEVVAGGGSAGVRRHFEPNAPGDRLRALRARGAANSFDRKGGRVIAGKHEHAAGVGNGHDRARLQFRAPVLQIPGDPVKTALGLENGVRVGRVPIRSVPIRFSTSGGGGRLADELADRRA